MKSRSSGEPNQHCPADLHRQQHALSLGPTATAPSPSMPPACFSSAGAVWDTVPPPDVFLCRQPAAKKPQEPPSSRTRVFLHNITRLDSYTHR